MVQWSCVYSETGKVATPDLPTKDGAKTIIFFCRAIRSPSVYSSMTDGWNETVR